MLQFHHDAMVLCTLMLDQIVHRSHRDFAVDIAFAVVVAVHVDPSLRWSYGSVIDSSVIGVSS